MVSDFIGALEENLLPFVVLAEQTRQKPFPSGPFSQAQSDPILHLCPSESMVPTLPGCHCNICSKTCGVISRTIGGTGMSVLRELDLWLARRRSLFAGTTVLSLSLHSHSICHPIRLRMFFFETSTSLMPAFHALSYHP